MKLDIFKTTHPDTFVIPTNLVPAPDPDVIAAASTATNIADIYKAFPRSVPVHRVSIGPYG